MALLVADCPRCSSSKMTFDVLAQVFRHTAHNWVDYYELFCNCRNCSLPTDFLVKLREYDVRDSFHQHNALVEFQGALNPYFEVVRFISVRDTIQQKPPEFLPQPVNEAFAEGAACLSIGCHNAAATMFRLCVDLVTRPLLPDPADQDRPQPNSRQRRDLGLRLGWLFDNKVIPEALRDLAACIREDANDGAHTGTLSQQDAEDVADFTTALLERLITEPQKLIRAEERRRARRQPN